MRYSVRIVCSKLTLICLEMWLSDTHKLIKYCQKLSKF